MKWSKKKVTNIFFVIGVVAVVVMLFTFDVSFVELWHHIRNAGWWLVPILGIWIVIYAMNAIAWGLITNNVKEKHQHIGFWRTFKLTVSGYALNYSTPVAGLGGEPYRIMELSRDIGNQRATSSVLSYVMTHILAHFIFWLVGIAIFVLFILTGNAEYSVPIAILTAVTALVIGGLIYLFMRGYKGGLAMRLAKLLTIIPGKKRWSLRLIARHRRTLENVDRQIVMLHNQDKRTFYGSLAVEFLARFVQSLEILFMMLLFDAGSPNLGIAFLQSVFILTVATIMSNLLGFLPMQLGGQEGGFVLAIALLGLPPALGIFICIICRVREITWIIIGLVLMKIGQTVNIRTAVIMAAGMGTRFGDKTKVMPKGFIPFNGIPMVERSIRTLVSCGIRRIIIGTGYHKEYYEELASRYRQVECVFSPRFAETNSMYTLWNCREAIGDNDFVLLESDLVFEKKAIDTLKRCPYESAMLITPVTKFQDQYYVQMDDHSQLVNCSTDSTAIDPSGELVGIHKISNKFYKTLCSEYEKVIDEKPKLGYEFMLLDVSRHVTPMNVVKVNGLQWYEIDDDQDLTYAENNISIE